MAHHKSAIKRIRKSKQQNEKNRHYRSTMRTMLKKVLTATEKEKAEALLKETTSILDKLAAKKIIHPNKAANQKSRITLHVNRLTASAN